MSKKKQGGKLIQQKRTQPKYLGVKLHDGEKATSGSILVRQRGTKYLAGDGVRVGRDHTLFAVKSGVVRYLSKQGRKIINIGK